MADVQQAGRSRYSSGAIALHWIIGLMIIGTALGGMFHESFGKEMEGPLIDFHKASGITILFLSVLRLGWRLTHRPPSLAATLKRWEVGLAHATHWIFYILMFAIPLSGWLMVSAGSRKWPIDWFGLFNVPFLPVAQSKPFGGAMHESHEIMGYFVLALAGLHIVAAIKHHYFDGDNTVERMLPLLRARR